MINYNNITSSASENNNQAYFKKSVYKNNIEIIDGIYADIYIRFGTFYFKRAVVFFSNFIKINNITHTMDNAIYYDNLYEIKLKSKHILRFHDYTLYKCIKNRHTNNYTLVYYNNYI